MYFICYNFDLFSNVNIYPRENIWKLQHFKNNQDVENLTSDGIDHNVLKRKLQIDIVRKIWGLKILSLQSTNKPYLKAAISHFDFLYWDFINHIGPCKIVWQNMALSEKNLQNIQTLSFFQSLLFIGYWSSKSFR